MPTEAQNNDKGLKDTELEEARKDFSAKHSLKKQTRKENTDNGAIQQ